MTVRRVAAFCGAAFAVAWLWSATASAIYLGRIGFLSEFKPPWLQWWIAVHYAIEDGWTGWTTLYVWFWLTVSAGIPSVLLGAAVMLWHRKRDPGSDLYGKSGWANRRDMARNGIRTDRKAF